MADINLNIGSEDLNNLKKLLEDIRKEVDALKKSIAAGGGIVTDADVTRAKKLAVEQKKIENEMKKQEMASQRLDQQQEKFNRSIREASGIIGGLTKKANELRSELKSATSPEQIKKLQTELNGVNSALQKAKGTTASWSKALGSFQFKFNALGNIAANVLSKITRELTQAAKEAIKLAREFDGVNNAFQKLPNATKLIRDLRQATRGTVNDLQLMKNAVMANNFRIPLEQLAKYFEFASTRAYQTGQSVDYLTESIVLGLSRESVKIIDNLGISMLDIRKEMETTGDMATAVGNIIDRDMGGLGDSFDNAKVKSDQLKASLDNLKIAWGGFIADSGFAEYLVGFLTDAVIQVDNLDIAFKRVSKKSMEESERTFDVFQQLNNKQGKAIQKITKDYLEASTEKIIADRQEILSSLEKSKKANLNQKEAVELYKVLLVRANERERIEVESDNRITGVKRENITLLKQELEFWEKARDEASLSEVASINQEIAALEKKIKAYMDAGKAAVISLPLPDIKEVKDLDAEWNRLFSGLFKGTDLGVDFWTEWFDGFDDPAAEQKKKDKEFLEGRAAEYEKAADKEIEAAKNKKDRINQIESDAFSFAKNAATTFTNLFEAQKQKELSAAGDNAAKREQIEIAYAKKQQNIAMISAIVNTAEGIVKVLSDYGLPWGLIPAAAMAALGAAEISTIKSQKFAEGGDVRGEPHSRGGVQIEAEGGEYVINKKSTSKYKSLIEAINQDDQMRIMDAMSRDKKITITQSDEYTKKMYDLMREQVQYGEDNEYYYKHKGNMLIKTRKS